MRQESDEPAMEEYLSVLWRRKYTILAIWALATAAVTAGAYLTPPVYTATTALIVRFGREFIYPSEVTGLDSSKTFSLEEMVNSEVEILSSRDLALEVVEELGVEKLYPDLLEEELDTATILGKATARFRDHLEVTAVLESSIIRLTFEHSDPEVAAGALNVLVDRFKDKHLEVFGQSQAGFLESQLEGSRKELGAKEAALQQFKKNERVFQVARQEEELLGERGRLQEHLRAARFRMEELEGQLATVDSVAVLPAGIPSPPAFSTRRAALAGRQQELRSLLEDAEVRLSELKETYTRLAKRRGEPAGALQTPDRSPLRVLDEARLRLLDLGLKQKDLRRNFGEESRDLRAVERQIAIVEEFLSEREAQLRRSARVGVSDEWGSLQARRRMLQAQLARTEERLEAVDAEERAFARRVLEADLEVQRSREKTLLSELGRVESELAALAVKGLDLRRLERQVAQSEERLRGLLGRLEEARTSEALDERKIVNVRVIEKAAPPVSPSGLSKTLKVTAGTVVGLALGVVAALLAGGRATPERRFRAVPPAEGG